MQQKGRDVRLALFSRCHHVDLDQQSRVLIPRELRDHAALTGKVSVVGAGECLQIWEPSRYASELERIDATIAATMESLAERR